MYIHHMATHVGKQQVKLQVVDGEITKENVEEETIEEKISVFGERHFCKRYYHYD